MLGIARWQSLVDFLVLALAFYVFLRWARSARALRIALGVVGVHALALVARQLGLIITSWLLDGLAALAVVVLLLVFQPELRRVFMHLDSAVRRLALPRAAALQHPDAVAEACFALAAARLGALIVLVRGDAIGELCDGGVWLGADVSAPLLTALFQKDSPLHDGALIIENDQVAQANVVLPLTHRPDVPFAYGTRHRAALGLAERSDAMVVVVSEERGLVSLVHGTTIQEVDSPAHLAALLQQASRGERVPLAAHLRRAVRTDVPLKLGALGLASLIWSMSVLAAGTTIRTVTVPIEFRSVPAGMEIVDQSAESVEVQVRGSAWIVDTVNLAGLTARFKGNTIHLAIKM